MAATTTPRAKILDDLDLIPREDFARAVRRSVRMLKRDALLRRGPTPITYGRRVFYRRRDIQRHFDSLAKKRTT